MAAISEVFYNSAATTSASLSGSGVAAGDYIIVFAYRNTTTAPSLISGYTSIATGSGNSNSFTMMYKVATGSETTTGVATNANVVHVGIYRGVSAIGNNTSGTHAANASLAIPSFTLKNGHGRSWVVQAGGSKQTTSQGNFATYTTRGKLAGTSCDTIFGDTNGGVASYAGDSSANGASATYAYAAVELIGTTALDGFSDNFNSGTLSSNWQASTGGNTTVANANSELEFTTTTTAGDAAVSSVNGYDLTGSYGYIQVVDAGNQSLASLEIYFWLSEDGDAWFTGSTNQLLFYINTNNLTAYKVVGGVQTSIHSAAYNSSTMKFLRIRESAGTTYFDYSADASSWTNFTSLANPITVTNVFVTFQAGPFANEASTTVVKLDNFNTTGSTTFTQTLTAGITPGGALTKSTNKSLTSGITPSGSLTRQIAHHITAGLTPTATLIKQTAHNLTAGLTPSGSLAASHIFSKALTATLTMSGTLVRTTNKKLTAGLTPTGALIKTTYKNLVGAGLTPSGSLVKLTNKSITASLNLTASLSRSFLQAFLKLLSLFFNVPPAIEINLSVPSAIDCPLVVPAPITLKLPVPAALNFSLPVPSSVVQLLSTTSPIEINLLVPTPIDFSVVG